MRIRYGWELALAALLVILRLSHLVQLTREC